MERKTTICKYVFIATDKQLYNCFPHKCLKYAWFFLLLIKRNKTQLFLAKAAKTYWNILRLIPMEEENHLTRMGFELSFKLDVVFFSYKEPLQIIKEHYVLQMALLKESLYFICNIIFFFLLLHYIIK